MSHKSTIRYVINAADEISVVGGAWNEFAVANDGADLAEAQVLGRSLWDFITDESTRDLYEKILARVRQGKMTRFTLRCDGPSYRQLLEMKISAQADGAVEFSTQTLHIEYREPELLLARGTVRSQELLQACAWCNRINVGADAPHWVEVEAATERLRLFEQRVLPRLTHGICQQCLVTMENTLEQDATDA